MWIGPPLYFLCHWNIDSNNWGVYQRVFSRSDSFSTWFCWNLAISLFCIPCLHILTQWYKNNLHMLNMVSVTLWIYLKLHSEGTTQIGQGLVFTVCIWKDVYHLGHNVKMLSTEHQCLRSRHLTIDVIHKLHDISQDRLTLDVQYDAWQNLKPA